MGEKTIARYQGFLLPAFTHDDLRAKGVGTGDSSYTQSGPRPGVPEPSREDGLVVVASGVQAEDGEVQLLAKRAGATGAEEAGFLWRDVAAGDTTSQWKGWDPYQVITGWESIIATTSTSLWYAWQINGIQLQSGAALFVVAQGASTKTIRLDSYDPTTSTWAQIAGPTLADTCGGGSLVQMPSGRVLLFVEAQSNTQVDVYFSDDSGATWEEYSLACLRTDLSNANQKTSIRAAVSGGEVSLIVQDLSLTDTWWQYASDDDGTRFSLVEEDWDVASSTIDGCDLIGLPGGGGFVLCYANDEGAAPYNYASRKIVSAWDRFQSATVVSLTPQGGGPTAQPSVAASTLWLDEDGFLYAGVTIITPVRMVLIMRSTDEGASWTHIGHAPIRHASDASPHSFGAVPVAGRLAFLTRWGSTGSAYDPYSAACVWLGGYGTHTAPAASSTSAFGAVWGAFADGTSIAYHQAVTGKDGGNWIPLDVPDGDWNASGAGTFALNATGTATFSDAKEYRTETSATAGEAFAEFICYPQASYGMLKLRLVDDPASATTLYEVRVSLTSTGVLSVYDINASAVAGTDTTGIAAGWTRVRVALDGSGNVRTWYANEAHVGEWTEGPEATGLTSTASNVTNRCIFGAEVTGADVDWKLAGYTFWPYRWSPENLGTKIGAAWSNPDSLHPRSMPARATTLGSGLKVRGIAGIARKGDEWTISTRYDNGVSLAFPDVEPSPHRPWRSSDLTEQVFTLDRESVTFSLGAGTSYQDSTAVGFFFIGANFKEFHAEGWNGSSWVSLGTGDASEALSSLTFNRYGSRVRPHASTATGAQYVFNAAHVGDTFDLGGGEADERYRRITANTEGAWTASTARTPVITLGGMTGDEVASGAGAIWCRDFGVIVHDHTETYEAYRVRIPAATTADGYFQGTLVAGPVYAFGSQYDQRWSVAKERPYRDQSLPNGRRRRKSIGKMRRVLDIGWTENAVDSSKAYRSQATELDAYIVPGATEPGSSVDDTLSMVEGLVESADGAPIILLRRVPSGSATAKVNVRESFVFGRIVSDTQRDSVLGDEVASSVDRLNTLRIEEEV